MRRRRSLAATTAALVFLAVAPIVRAGEQDLGLPPLPAPESYGNVTLGLAAKGSGMPGVVFSHWSHRTMYTCRVCHFELEFGMRANTTDITHDRNQQGKFCGACHDGKVAFPHRDENCERCHREADAPDPTLAQRFAVATGDLPKARYGNKVDWSEAMVRKLIKPKTTIQNTKSKVLDKTLEMKPEWQIAPPAVFPHAPHTEWLDCANCHPGIFAIKKDSTEHLTMTAIIEGASCGVCHVRVAFPLNDCKRCHPKWVD